MNGIEVGKDVVFKEKEVLKELLVQLPLKAQLGFSALKDQMTQKGEYGFRKLLHSARPHDAIKLEYTCLDISKGFIVLGCNLGLVFFFNRKINKLSRFVCEVKHSPISSLKILESKHFVASGQYNGNLTIFNYITEKNGTSKPLLKCTVESHHVAPVTAIQWTPDGTKLFTGDSEGHVAITVINMDEGQTHTVFICKEESPVVQLSFSHTALLISTLRRSLIWPFNTKTPVQVGQQERKLYGNFGACFLPSAKAVPSELQPVIYAARPGLRIWKATMEGKVSVTMFFKESIFQGDPEIQTLGLPAKKTTISEQEQRQFGTLEVLHDSYIVSFQGPCLWVIDPVSGRLIGCHGNLGCVLDVAVLENEIFVLTKGDEHFIRKITFSSRSDSPIIEVKELNLDEHNEVNLRRSSSVCQFEESATLERLIDDVGNTMVGIISGVKSTVVRTIGQITTKEDSEEEKSDGGYGTAGSYSSPMTILRSPYNGVEGAELDPSQSPGSLQNDAETPGTLNGFTGSSPESTESNKDIMFSEYSEEKSIVDVVIEHKERESEAPFQHLAKQEYPEIVFAGTSKGIPVKRRKKRKFLDRSPGNSPASKSGNQSLEESRSSIVEETTNSQASDDRKDQDPPLPRVSLFANTTLEAAGTPTTTAEAVHGTETLNDNTLNDKDIDSIEHGIQPMNDVGLEPWNAAVNGTDPSSSQEQKIVDDGLTSRNILSISATSLNSDSSGSSADMDELTQNNLAQEMEKNELAADDLNVLCPCNASNLDVNPPCINALPDVECDDKQMSSEFCNELPLKESPQELTTCSAVKPGQPVTTSECAEQDCSLDSRTPPDSGAIISKTKDKDLTQVNSTVRKKSHKKVNSLSALIDLQLVIKETEKDKDMACIRDRVHRNLLASTFGSFKSRSCSMDSLNVNRTSSLALPINLMRPDTDDSRYSVEGLLLKRRPSASSSISSTARSEPSHTGEPDDNILNVEISTQDSYLEKSSSSERCKTIEGEAVERNYTKDNKNYFDSEQDDISSNLIRLDEDTERVTVEDKPRAKRPHEPSPFPPPQISTLTSIYSQETVSVSDICFSEPSTPNEEDSTDDKFATIEREQDSYGLESIDSDDAMSDDNRCNTPPVNLDTYGGVELTDVVIMKKHRSQDQISDDFSQVGESETESVKDQAIELSPSAYADRVSERLLLLADSWAEITLPSCGQVQFLTVTDLLAWCIDNHDHIFYSPSSSLNVNWKRLDGRARLISSNQSGTVVWAVCRKRCAYYRTNVKDGNPQGSDWEPVEKDVLCVAVDDSGIWGIKMNGDVFVRTGVSSTSPQGRGWRTIRVASDLVQISCVDGVVWALDIYNHVQIYQVEREALEDDGHVVLWKELPGISASYVRLGPRGVCWIIDRDGGIWFNLEISKENVYGSMWYQLSWSDSFLHDSSLLSSVMSYFKQSNDPKSLAASDSAGVWILSKYGTIRVSRGHLLGTRWELKGPSGVPSTSFWTCITAESGRLESDFIWALQPNGKLHCFNPDGRNFVIQSPPKTVLKYISASSNSLWALTSGSDVYIRRGISTVSPQGLKWTKVDMTSQGQEKLCHICAGDLVVWAVDYKGSVWFQMGKEEQRHGKVAPAWLQVEGCPFDGCRFIKVVVGGGDVRVWALDDRDNVYVRKDVTDDFLIGVSWEVVPGTGAKDLAISDSLVWALCPNGDVICRYGVSTKNCMGDYWKKAPGCFDQISVGGDDELWGIDRQGQLYQRQTIHFFGAQSTKKAPSYSQLFAADEDWELI